MKLVANSGQRARSSALPFREFWPLPQSRGRHFKQQLEFYAGSDVNYHGVKVGDPHSDFEQEKGEPPEFQSLQCFKQLKDRAASLSLVYHYQVYCEIFPTFNTVTGNFSSDENIYFLAFVVLQHFILAKQFLVGISAHLITPVKALSLCDPQRL